MNKLNAIILKILSNPYFSYNKWWVDVQYDCWGKLDSTKLPFDSKEEAEALGVNTEILI